MFDPFVRAVVTMYRYDIERIGRVVYRCDDFSLTIYLRRGHGDCDEELRWLHGEEETFRKRAQAEGMDFVDGVVRRLFRHAGWADSDIERSDIGDDASVPPAVRRTTTWFIK